VSDEFDTSVEDNTQPGVLRQKLEQALAALKQKDKELADLRTAEAQRSVKSTWDELKVPDAIRKLYNGDTSPDAIKSWWEDSKGLFNVQAGEEQPTGQEPSQEELAQRNAAQLLQEASGLGTSGLQGGNAAAFAKAQEIKSKGTGATQADLDALTDLMGIAKY